MVRCWAVVVVVLSLVPCGAAAGKATPREEAEILLRAGNALHDRGDFGGALVNYHHARRVFPSYKIDFNIGVTLMAMGRLTQAAQQFERFLLAARKVVEPAMKQEARRRLDRLRSRLGSVVVVCPVPGAVVAVEGAEVGRTPLEGRIYLRPGSYALTVTAPGRRPFKQTATLDGGAFFTLIVPWSEAATPPPPTLRPLPDYNDPGPRAGPPPVDLTPTRTAEPSRSIYRRWWFWTGIAAVVAGGVVAAVVLTRQEDGRIPGGELEPIR